MPRCSRPTAPSSRSWRRRARAGPTQLYVRRLNQLQATPLSGTEDALSPFFSPDGQWIGFSADRKLKKIAINGGASATLCDVPQLRGGSWGEDGTIVFSLSDQRSDAPDASVRRRAGRRSRSQPAPVVKSRSCGRRSCPGGKAVLYTSSDVVGAYNGANLVVQPLPDGPRKIVQRGGFYGRYLPSGHLVYIHDGTLFAAPFDLDRLELTGPPAVALEGVASNSITGGAQFSVSASGTLVYLPGPMKGAGIPIDWMNPDGQTSPLRATRANWFNPRFSPDGRRLAMEILEGQSDIWIYESERDVLTPFDVRSGGRQQTRLDA